LFDVLIEAVPFLCVTTACRFPTGHRWSSIGQHPAAFPAPNKSCTSASWFAFVQKWCNSLLWA